MSLLDTNTEQQVSKDEDVELNKISSEIINERYNNDYFNFLRLLQDALPNAAAISNYAKTGSLAGLDSEKQAGVNEKKLDWLLDTGHFVKTGYNEKKVVNAGHELSTDDFKDLLVAFCNNSTTYDTLQDFGDTEVSTDNGGRSIIFNNKKLGEQILSDMHSRYADMITANEANRDKLESGYSIVRKGIDEDMALQLALSMDLNGDCLIGLDDAMIMLGYYAQTLVENTGNIDISIAAVKNSNDPMWGFTKEEKCYPDFVRRNGVGLNRIIATRSGNEPFYYVSGPNETSHYSSLLCNTTGESYDLKNFDTDDFNFRLQNYNSNGQPTAILSENISATYCNTKVDEKGEALNSERATTYLEALKNINSSFSLETSASIPTVSNSTISDQNVFNTFYNKISFLDAFTRWKYQDKKLNAKIAVLALQAIIAVAGSYKAYKLPYITVNQCKEFIYDLFTDGLEVEVKTPEAEDKGLDTSVLEGWNESINALYSLLKSWVENYGIDPSLWSDAIKIDDIRNANAKGTSTKSYLDPIPFVNKLGQTYLEARSDELEQNREHMDYTNDNGKVWNEDGTLKDNAIGAAINLLMPQYQRRVEVEDLNENFWVISQVLTALADTLYGNGLNEILQGQLAEIMELWNNVKYLWNMFDAYGKTLNDLSIGLKRMATNQEEPKLYQQVYEGYQYKTEFKDTLDNFTSHYGDVYDIYTDSAIDFLKYAQSLGDDININHVNIQDIAINEGYKDENGNYIKNPYENENMISMDEADMILCMYSKTLASHFNDKFYGYFPNCYGKTDIYGVLGTKDFSPFSYSLSDFQTTQQIKNTKWNTGLTNGENIKNYYAYKMSLCRTKILYHVNAGTSLLGNDFYAFSLYGLYFCFSDFIKDYCNTDVSLDKENDKNENLSKLINEEVMDKYDLSSFSTIEDFYNLYKNGLGESRECQDLESFVKKYCIGYNESRNKNDIYIEIVSLLPNENLVYTEGTKTEDAKNDTNTLYFNGYSIFFNFIQIFLETFLHDKTIGVDSIERKVFNYLYIMYDSLTDTGSAAVFK